MSTRGCALYAEQKAVFETGLEAVMDGRSTIDTLDQAMAQFETIEIPERTFALCTHREYSHSLLDLSSYLTREGQALYFSSN